MSFPDNLVPPFLVIDCFRCIGIKFCLQTIFTRLNKHDVANAFYANGDELVIIHGVVRDLIFMQCGLDRIYE